MCYARSIILQSEVFFSSFIKQIMLAILHEATKECNVDASLSSVATTCAGRTGV